MNANSLHEIRFKSLLILFTVVLSTLSLPGGPWPALGAISLVPLAVGLHGTRPIAAASYAYACAFFGWLASTLSLATAFSTYTAEPLHEGIIAVIVACAFEAIPYGLFGLIYGRFQLSPLQAASCLTLMASLFPTPFPIHSIHALWAFPQLIQILDLGGQPLLLFVFYLFTWYCAEVILTQREKRSPKYAIATLLSVTVLVPAYGYFRLHQFTHFKSRRSMTIGVLQPNIPLGGDSNPHSAEALNPFHTLVDMSASFLSVHRDIDLVVWPETPLLITCRDDYGTRPELSSLLLRFPVPLLINCAEPAPGGGVYNTQLLLTPDGKSDSYHKLILLPLAEYLPGESRFPWLRQIFPSSSHYVSAPAPVVLHVANHPGIAVAICYEVLFPAHVRQLIRLGGEILVTPANDAWFGNSRIPDFQVAASVFEAVQYRVPVVRVSNSGNSLAVSPSGEIIAESRTPLFTRAAAAYTVQVSAVRSFYSRVGDTFLYTLGVMLLVGLAKSSRAASKTISSLKLKEPL